MIASTGPTTFWYLSRGAGVVALLLLTGAVLLGIAGPLRVRPRVLLAGLHRSVPLLAIAFVVAHVLTTVADGYAPIGLRDAVIPFLSPYRPIWLGLGTVAFDLLLAVVATSLLRSRIGLTGWRAVHWLSYASWPVALVHGLGTGTDARSGWLVVLSIACTLVVAAAIVLRALRAPTLEGGLRIAALVAVPATVLGVFAWAESGPLQHGWARRAGTPVTLIAGGVHTVAASVPRTSVSSSVSTPRPAPPTPTPYTARISGSLTQTQANSSGIATVQIDASTSGPVAGKLRATLYGEPLPGGGLSMQSSDVAYATAGAAAAFRGPVVALEGTRLTAVVSDASGHHLRLDLDLRIDPASGNVRGELRVRRSSSAPSA